MKLKQITSFILCAGAVALTFTSIDTLALPGRGGAPQGGGPGTGTDILHLQVGVTMTNTGVETNASGRVTAQQNIQGNANIQRFDVAVKGLATNSIYWLYAASVDETNLSPVTSFTTGTN